MHLDLKDLTRLNRMLLDLINHFNKVVGFKLKVQKLSFPCTNNKLAEKEIREISYLCYVQKIVKILSINLTNEVNNFIKKIFKICKGKYIRFKDLLE